MPFGISYNVSFGSRIGRCGYGNAVDRSHNVNVQYMTDKSVINTGALW